ncbi:FAD-dependent oxidoreductase [Micrococcoides hystricis]|uniref:FAD-dependent oxidoreductase n=1 Tax=Micrococcoides hystricis TaxID=1572761 RepID=A0ABV6PDB2_9MICC
MRNVKTGKEYLSAGTTKCDVLVVGSGVSGLATAIRAAHEGLSVIVAEQSTHFGGTTALSAGWAWVPGNLKGATASEDTREEIETYLKALSPENYDAERVKAFLDTVPEAIDFFEQETAVEFTYPEKAPDYQMDLPGAKIGGRAILPSDANAEILGDRRLELQPYLSSYTVFGYMPQVGPDLTQFLHANQSLKSFGYVTRKLLKTWADIALHKQPRIRTNGSALIVRMIRSALDLGVRVWTGTPVKELIRDSKGSVVGARIGGKHGGKVMTRYGVVLAGGGFSGNEQLRRKYFEHDADGGQHFTPTQGHDGSSAEMALEVGGVISEAVSSVGSWAPVTVFRHLRSGKPRLFPHLRQIGLPGMITVDRKGKRFGNEALSYHDFGGAMLDHMRQEKEVVAWIIGDKRLMDKYGIGYAKPWPVPRGFFRTVGYLKSGNSLAELAGRLGIDSVELESTVKRFNDGARQGVDHEFGRGSTAYNHFRGDMLHKPNPNLAPLEKGPFYAAEVRMGDLGTFAGIDTDSQCRVLNEKKEPIRGLFAVGAAAVSVFGGGYPGYGSHIGPGLVFGYRLGRDILKLSEQLSTSTIGDKHIHEL